MFDKTKAAQYFVVAWVKNWRIQTYLDAIGARDLDYEKIHDFYPWLPANDNKHMYFKNCLIRAWISLAMNAINNKLWDTDDNMKRLQLAKQIENWDSSGAKAGTAHKKDVHERYKSLKKDETIKLGYKLSVETMRRGNGHHWNVCK